MKHIEFKEVANLYIGCKIQTKEVTGTFNVLYTPGDVKPKSAIPIGSYDLVKSELHFKEVKPILRQLSAMTKEEYKVIWEDLNTTIPVVDIDRKMEPKLFLYLIKQVFDLFNLIESGQAIDKTKI